MRADELEQISHTEMLKVRLHSPRGGAPLQNSKSMISPRALAAARSASVRPLDLAPAPPTQGSIVKLVKPKHVAPSPPSSSSPQPSPPITSARSPRSPRRKSTRGHIASNTSNDSSSTQPVRLTVSSSPRSPRQRHRSPRRHRSPAPTSPRRHHSSSNVVTNPSQPVSPRLEPDEYRAALREVRAELVSLAERHEREVGELRAERDDLRARLDAAERRLRAFESNAASTVVTPAADAAVRSPSRRTRHRSSGGSRIARDPTYHVSTSSSSAEKQISALERKQAPSLMRPASLSTSSSDDAVGKRTAGSRIVSAQMRKSQQTGSSSDDEAPARVRGGGGGDDSDSSESIVMHGASSAKVTPARPQQQQKEPGTMSTSTLGSVVLAGAEDVSLFVDDDDDAHVEIVQPSGVEIVEASTSPPKTTK
jgi:hypothetical protein